MKITVVGCGIMGSSLINALMEKGNEVHIVDLNEKAAKPFVEKGALYSADLKDATDTEMIIVNLPNDNITLNVLKSIDLTGKKVVNTSTSTPNEAEEVGKYVVDNGGRYLDCKIECYPQEVGTENGFFVYSGEEALFSELKGTFTAFSDEPVYLGESVGASAVIDMGVAIILHCGIFFSSIEASALALKHNVDIKVLSDSIETIMPALTAVTVRQLRDALSNGIPEKYEDAKEASLAIEYHALENAVTSLRECGINGQLTEKMREMMSHQVEAGNGNKDFVVMMQEIL